MRIAIAAESDDKDAKISSSAGRAPFYFLYDGKKLIRKINNVFSVGGGGAGWSVVRLYLVEDKIEMLVASGIGPNMEAALKSKNMKFRKMDCKVSEALKELSKLY